MKKEDINYWLDYIKDNVSFNASAHEVLDLLKDLGNWRSVFVIARSLSSKYVVGKEEDALRIYEDLMDNYLVKENFCDEDFSDNNVTYYERIVAICHYEMGLLYASAKSDYGKALESINACLGIIDKDNSGFLDINIDRVDVVRERDKIISLL